MDDKEFWRQWWGNEPTELELIDMAREANQHIVTDINKLNKPCDLATEQEGKEIGELLVRCLKDNSETWAGIAANQLGINKKVIALKVKTSQSTSELLYFVNPTMEITGNDTFYFREACLSFPGKQVSTKRWSCITVSADNIEGKMSFQAYNEESTFECACIQHEIDHVEGITMYDRQVNTQVKSDKIGRNEKVTITNGPEVKTMKYKKAEPLINTGEWRLCQD